jgi:acyl carrier protein
MDISNFIESFIEQFEDEPTCEVTAETVFRDIDGWSSIVALSVMAMVDEEYDVQLTADEMRKANTIGDLFNTVSSKA